MTPENAIFETQIPGRLDRLPWAGFHWLVVTALGVTWILDGLEVTLVGSLSGALQEGSLHLSSQQIGLTASAYLGGAVAGALFFGWLTDLLGRKRLFTVTVLIYLLATIASGFALNFWMFAICRAITGAGIGGEYAAVNATIQELIPARRRGFTDLVINGTYWLGAALGAAGSLLALDPKILPPDIGWRAAFIIGGIIGLIALLLRRWIPESPRWLMTHGQPEEANHTMDEIEQRVARETGRPLPPITEPTLRLRSHHGGWFRAGIAALLGKYRSRTILGVTLMAAQAFCYNAVFFTYALILTQFYRIPSRQIGLFMLPFAAGNFAGPLLLGPLFDRIGRRIMIAATYIIAGVLMAVVGWLFAHGALSARSQTIAWTVIFFFASAAASSAYLTVGESFPLEVRAIAIALFYAVGTAAGGVVGPALFGALIQSGSRTNIMWGYLLGAALMVVGGVTAWVLGSDAERKSLETVAPPLSAA